MADFELSWEAPEFEFREKTVSWYWVTIIGAVLILALAVWQRNFLFGVFILMAEALIFEFNKKFRPAARMSIPKNKLADIKKILSNFVDEIEIQRSLVDSFQKF